MSRTGSQRARLPPRTPSGATRSSESVCAIERTSAFELVDVSAAVAHLVQLDDSYQRGHVSLPNGLGLPHANDDGTGRHRVSTNARTSTDH